MIIAMWLESMVSKKKSWSNVLETLEAGKTPGQSPLRHERPVNPEHRGYLTRRRAERRRTPKMRLPKPILLGNFSRRVRLSVHNNFLGVCGTPMDANASMIQVGAFLFIRI
jgi:hypothetical protein